MRVRARTRGEAWSVDAHRARPTCASPLVTLEVPLCECNPILFPCERHLDALVQASAPPEPHLKRSCPRSHPDCDSGRSWGSADQVGVQQTKLTPANPARAMKNLREIAAYFDANGRDADARRLLTPSEACANVTTIGRMIWDALNTSAGCEIDANSRAHGGAPRCDTSSKGPVPGRQQAWLGHGRKPRRLN